MGEIIGINEIGELEEINDCRDLMKITENILLDTRTEIDSDSTITLPIIQMATLGAGVSSLIPALRTVTQTTGVSTKGLYTLANASVGDTLKLAKNGNFWGAFKTAEGGSKFAQLQEAMPLTATSKMVMPIDPATMMMAAALFSIEQQLGNIEEMEKQILSFLEYEKEAEIESDIETLMNVIKKFKYNWDNEHFVASNHKMVLDIQRNSRKNMNFSQKKINDLLKSKQFLVAQSNINTVLKDMEKSFKYYRLAMYSYSLASMLEIMLGGNYKEEYIEGIRDEIESLADTYRETFLKASIKLEKMGGLAIETNILKGLGNASKGVGKLVGTIPFVKDNTVEDFLIDGGKTIKKSAYGLEQKAVREFAMLKDPEINVFSSRMNEMIKIYNHTTQISFDEDNVYLIAK